MRRASRRISTEKLSWTPITSAALVNNYADDDQIENTSISYPIAFSHSIIYGAEAKLMVPDWHGFSGFASYSYIVGQAWFPVTGGLFLGDDAAIPITGPFAGLAGPAQHRSRTRTLSSGSALLDRGRDSVRYRAPV